MRLFQDADLPPTEQAVTALAEAQDQIKQLLAKWNTLKAKVISR